MMNQIKQVIAGFVFGMSCVIALPFAALYGLLVYVQGCYSWGKKLVAKFSAK